MEAHRLEATTADRAIAILFAPLFIIGILATLADPAHWFEVQVGHPLQRLLGKELGAFVALPLIGLFWPLPAFMGAFMFNAADRKFRRHRVISSFLLLGAFYVLGNALDFKGTQWWWLHCYMLAQLAATGMAVAKLRPYNCLAFGLFCMGVVVHARPFWALLDFVWAMYFVAAAFMVWSVPVETAPSA